jgi:hypothetical protein
MLTIDLDLLQNNGWTARRGAEGWEIVDPKGTTVRTNITRADAKSLIDLLSAERPTDIPKEAEQLVNNAWSEEKVLAVLFREIPGLPAFGGAEPTFDGTTTKFKPEDFSSPEKAAEFTAEEARLDAMKARLDAEGAELARRQALGGSAFTPKK